MKRLVALIVLITISLTGCSNVEIESSLGLEEVYGNTGETLKLVGDVATRTLEALESISNNIDIEEKLKLMDTSIEELTILKEELDSLGKDFEFYSKLVVNILKECEEYRKGVENGVDLKEDISSKSLVTAITALVRLGLIAK